MMRCDEIQERIVELLYQERGTPAASPELRAHVYSCPACRIKLQELKNAQSALRLWQDEPLIRPLPLPLRERPFRLPWGFSWKLARYGAIAALAAIALLALGNSDIAWNGDGFSFRTHLFSAAPADSEYYTKAEVRDILKKVLDDSEARMTETNYLMIQQMMDTIERERWSDLLLVRNSPGRNRIGN